MYIYNNYFFLLQFYAGTNRKTLFYFILRGNKYSTKKMKTEAKGNEKSYVNI